jgi:signal transduction histidine kinase/DNA-binding NarL/FixJ family response regulator
VARPVLLIDDIENYRASVVSLFANTGYEIIEAASPAEGIALLDENPHLQVILLDLSFDDVPGTAVLDHIASRSSEYRVIVLTGHEELLLADQAGAYDVFHYLPKAQDFAAQSILFSVAQAFNNLDHAHLARKVDCLLRAQKRINKNEPIAETFDLICRCVCDIVGAYTCHIRVYDFRHGDFHVRGFAGPNPELRALFDQPKEKGNDFTGQVVQRGVAQLFDDLKPLPAFLKFRAESLARQWASVNSKRNVLEYFDRAASAYIAPISTGLYGDLVDAVLNVSSDHREFFTPEKQALVDEFVNQAALAVTKDWLQQKRRDAHQDYGSISTMLAAMSQATRKEDPLSAVYSVVTEQISSIVNPEIVSVFRYDETTGMIRNMMEVRGGQTIINPDEEYKPGQSLTGHVFSDEETIHLPWPDDTNPRSPTEDRRYDSDNEKKYLEKIPSGELKHYLGVPIRVGNRVRGVLRALNKKSDYYNEGPPNLNRRCLLERGFSHDCRNALEIAATHLAAAIHNVELLQEKDREVVKVHTLGAVGRLINSQTDIRELLKITITKMAEEMNAEICMLFLKDEQEDRVVLRQSYGIDADLIPNAFYVIGEGVTGWVAKYLQPRLIGTAVANDGKYDHQIQAHLTKTHGVPTTISSLMAVPIQARDHLLGVMKVINKVGDHLEYDTRDLELFQTFADTVGVAIYNAQVYKLTNDRLAIAERNSALSLLVSAVAHEINNTSGVIPANVDALREYLAPAENQEIKKMLDVIEDAAEQSVDFANELAGFSASQRGQQKALDVNIVIRDAIDLLATQYWDPETTPVELPLSMEPLICEIYRTPFLQVVRNIVINAIQALDKKEGGRIRISTAREVLEGKDTAVIRFEDNGPGIRPEYYDKIFAAEFTTKAKGNGIGLWLVRSQLEAVGGTIAIDQQMSNGAAFIVRIPLATHMGPEQ